VEAARQNLIEKLTLSDQGELSTAAVGEAGQSPASRRLSENPPVFRPAVESQAPAERETLQRNRLRSLLARLRGCGSEYWREKLRGVEAESPLAELPLTTKAELRDAFPFGMLAVPLAETVRVHASSGTHGKPTIVAYTAADVELFAEVNARALACAGALASDVLHVAYGYGLFTGGLGLHYGGELLGATVVPASGGNAELQLELLADLGADGIACTPSFCLLLAERARESGLAERIRLRYGVLGAEPWSEAMRAKIESAWGGAFDACDIYGLSEVIGPGVAAECREGKGAMHVFDDVFLPEVLEPETGEPAEEGELVLTTLTKEALPVLRYRSGDVTAFVDEPCPCGRTHRRIARFSGRVDDMLVIRGVNVFPSAVEAAVLDDPALGGQYALVVDRRWTLTELEVHCELADAAAERDEIGRRLLARLEQRLRLRVRLRLVDPGVLPRSEVGKAKRVFERTGENEPFPAPD
jgi:phenylacetate-CoA ligase